MTGERGASWFLPLYKILPPTSHTLCLSLSHTHTHSWTFRAIRAIFEALLGCWSGLLRLTRGREKVRRKNQERRRSDGDGEGKREAAGKSEAERVSDTGREERSLSVLHHTHGLDSKTAR